MNNYRRIRFKDNQSYRNAYSLTDHTEMSKEGIPESYWEDIKKIRNVSYLLEQKKIVTFPQPKDDHSNKEIFSRVNDKIYTYNWVGVLISITEDGIHYRIEVNSRFDSGNKQYFLLYLLCSVCGINAFDINIGSEAESDYTIIMVLLFFMKLAEAFEEGVYKEYVRKKYNEYNLKGAIDINRHIRINNPFVGKTAYLIKEHSYDNDILCLIRQTLEYTIDYYPEIWKGYLANNMFFNEILDIIRTTTTSYRTNVNYAETLKCGKEITHPMYQKYEDVRKIALMILQEAGQNVFVNKEETSLGILIDISWLWEEYIAVALLEQEKYAHFVIGISKDIQWSDKKYWYPDYVEITTDNAGQNVFDAKYKFWGWNKGEDIHQLLSYLYLTGGEICGIIYPTQDKPGESNDFKEINAFEKFYDKKPKIYKLPFFIPQSENIGYLEYVKEIKESINDWKKRFSQL